MAKKNKTQKGLSDKELVKKYEAGKIDMANPLKKMIKNPSNSSILKGEKTY